MNGHKFTKDVAKQATRAISDDQQAVREIRKLIIDCCRQNGGGHGGSAIGMAPLAVALWRYAMRYNPRNPNWFDRDRFVISNGHAAILLYTMLHVTGYEDMTIDELKMYANPKAVDKSTGKWKGTICHGHPEIEVPGVEVTTGPLGQGIANAVGLAIASKHHAATFNKDGHNIITSRIYCTTGDGCIQEGVALEAMAIAGRLCLNNLTLCYDNNAVTCDGPADWILVEDTNSKMRSMGWNVIDVPGEDPSVEKITEALAQAASETEKPTFINIKTTIGFGTASAGTFKSHHGTYSDEDAALFKAADVTSTHALSLQAKAYFRYTVDQGKKVESEWNHRLEQYTKDYPKEAKDLRNLLKGAIDFAGILTSMKVPSEIQATRQWNGTVFNELMSHIPNIMAGGADLWNSNQLGDQSSHIFDLQHPKGRVIRYGIREHAMASISNGLAAFSPGGIIPVTATFFMFYLYAAPGVRMGALSHLKVIHIATHDSIGEGQNGPTHQPVELDSLFRAMPNLLYIRPADSEEVLGAWYAALVVKARPSILSLARDPAITRIPGTNRMDVLRGGYVVVEKDDATVTLISCGSELQFACAAAEELNAQAIPTRVVSMPCIALFEEQPQEYQNSVLSNSHHIISVEAYISTIWARFCTASIAMDSFGYSGAGIENFARFGIDADGIVRKVKKHVSRYPAKGGVSIPHWTLIK
jgi:dihydroxyacetone synthase